jgi:hypothetical protein
MGKVAQPLQSVNCHDSYAHGHERHGPFTRLVGVCLGWFGLGLSWSSWYTAGAKLVCMVLGLATGGMPVSSFGLATGGMPESSVGLAMGGMPVSSIGFGYRWDACELYWFWLQVGCLCALVSLATGVTPVSLWLLVTVG